MYSLFSRLAFLLFCITLATSTLAESNLPNKTFQPIDVEITTHLGDAQTFVEGDQISFMLSLDKAAYVYLFYQDATKHIIQIIPNQRQLDNFFKAGLFIPVPSRQAGFRFTVQPPFGEEKLWAFAVDKPVLEFANSSRKKGFTQLDTSIEKIKLTINKNLPAYYGESMLTIFVTGK